MTRMFRDPSGQKVLTLNPVTGCQHECKYCYAERVINGRLRNSEKYKRHGFAPTKHPQASYRYLGKSKTFFVCSLGDLFGDWMTNDIIIDVLNNCGAADKSNTFLFLTKNPTRYQTFFPKHPHLIYDLNFIFGATIESNIEHPNISKAPLEFERIQAMRSLPKSVRKFVSIEPVMAFELAGFVRDIVEIAPEFVYIGYDNHGHGLPEPTESELQDLIAALRGRGIEVREKTTKRTGGKSGGIRT